MEHDFFFHLAFLSQIFDILQIFFQFRHFLLCLAFFIHVLCLLYGVLLSFGLKFFYLVLLLFSGLADMIVLLS